MPELDPSDHTIDELDDELDAIDDPEELRAIREAETDGDDRKGAKRAIDERLEEIEESEEADDASESGGDDADDRSDGDDADTTSSEEVGLVAARNRVRNVAADLIGRDLDGIVGVRADGEGWEATVEVVERHSVPDTQDILGRYAITLDSSGAVTEYRRLGRYRRGDTAPFEET